MAVQRSSKIIDQIYINEILQIILEINMHFAYQLHQTQLSDSDKLVDSYISSVCVTFHKLWRLTLEGLTSRKKKKGPEYLNQ